MRVYVSGELLDLQLYSTKFRYANFYTAHRAKVPLNQPTWSVYPYPLVFLIWYPHPLGVLIWLCCRHLSVNAIVLDMALLCAVMDAALSQEPLLWRHNDMAVIVSWNTCGPGARPTNCISIEFEIRSEFGVLWFEIWSTDHNTFLSHVTAM